MPDICFMGSFSENKIDFPVPIKHEKQKPLRPPRMLETQRRTKFWAGLPPSFGQHIVLYMRITSKKVDPIKFQGYIIIFSLNGICVVFKKSVYSELCKEDKGCLLS